MEKSNAADIHFDREKRSFLGLDDKLKKQLVSAYKNVDVNTELERMSVWLMSPKGIRRKGNLAFISSWLKRAAPCIVASDTKLDNSLEKLYADYRAELWENCQHILQMNKKKQAS